MDWFAIAFIAAVFMFVLWVSRRRRAGAWTPTVRNPILVRGLALALAGAGLLFLVWFIQDPDAYLNLVPFAFFTTIGITTFIKPQTPVVQRGAPDESRAPTWLFIGLEFLVFFVGFISLVALSQRRAAYAFTVVWMAWIYGRALLSFFRARRAVKDDA